MDNNFLYNITILTMRNPTIYDASIYKWIIEITSVNSDYIIYRTFATTTNYIIDIFKPNPN